MTNNFLIKKSIIRSIKFNEKLSGYGHEDTLFGYELAEREINICHIENNILNNDLEQAKVFLEKTKEGISNLYQISKDPSIDTNFSKNVTFLKYWNIIKPFSGVYLFVYSVFKKKIVESLSSKNPSLLAFDLYKLNEMAKVSKSS